jgi:hypothetical protein
MAIAGDSRFGQWADPSFGATLTGGQQQPQQGVLPTPDAATSASGDQNNGVVTPPTGPSNTFGIPGFSGMPGLMPQPGNSENNPGSIYLAAGGSPGDAEDDDQDSGNSQQSNTDPFSFIQSALQYGRQKMGLPSSFFGSDTGNSSAPSFAEGGSVDADEGDDGDQGVIPEQQDQPDQSQGQGQGQTNPQAAMAYLKGAGAMDPSTAAALERNVDPRGQLDPSARKLAALKMAGSPDKAFGLMQHYRQKFNAYNSFAKAAATGVQGKPADLRASAQAADQAYQHLPDGNAMRFMPVQGGMRVQVKPVGGAKPKHFDEGGLVDDDTGPNDNELQQARADDREQPEQNAPIVPDRADQPSQDDGQQGDQSDGPVKQALGGKAPHEALRDFVLSIPQYLGWLSKGGQFDESMEKGADATLADAAKSPMSPMNAGTAALPPQTRPAQQPTNGAPQRQQPQPNWPQPQQPQQAQGPRPTPQDPVKFGQQVGAKGGADGSSLQDVLHEIDQAYGTWAGQQKPRMLARAEARQHWMDNRAKVEAEQTKGAGALERAKVMGGSRERVAETNQQGHIQGIGMQQEGAGQRNERSNQTKTNISREKESGVESRFGRAEAGRTDRSIAMNQPSAIGDPKKMQQARQSMQPQQQAPQRPQAQGQQPQPAPEAAKRVAGTVYQTPKGPLTWTGTGWTKPGP